MLLSEICIKRPVFATVLSLMIVTLGAIFFSKLQIRGIPDIDQPIITVSASYPGADALYMEREITTRIEKALKTVKNLDYISSSSSTGSSNITLSFKLSADIEIALNDVRSKISEISYMFPSDMTSPSVSKMDSDSFPSLWLTITSDVYDSMTLTRIIEDNVQLVLEKLPSVGQANVFGGFEYTMLIEPDPIKMQQFKISPIEIEAAVRKQNQDYPAGVIKTDFRNFTLRLKGTLSTPQEFENIIIRNELEDDRGRRRTPRAHLCRADPRAGAGLRGRCGGQRGIARHGDRQHAGRTRAGADDGTDARTRCGRGGRCRGAGHAARSERPRNPHHAERASRAACQFHRQ